MKLLRGLLFALAMTAPAAVCDAGFVIDNFNQSALVMTVLSNGVTRTVTSSPSSTTSSVGGGVVTGLNATPAFNAAPRTRLNYASFGANDLSAFTGVETFVLLGAVTNNSSNALTVNAYKNASPSQTRSITVGAGETKSLIFNFGSIGAWSSLLLDFDGGMGQSFSFSANGPLVLSTIPEPTSIALIGCCAIGGLAAARRRKKVSAATAA